MRIYAVLDTNVLVSAMLTRHKNSATKRIIDAASDLSLTPLYHEDIIKEYKNVLQRDKFGFDSTDVENMLNVITAFGIRVDRTPTKEVFVDEDDAMFYEVALSKESAYVVTGNIKHFPKKPIVVTPSEMIKILENNGLIEKEEFIARFLGDGEESDHLREFTGDYMALSVDEYCIANKRKESEMKGVHAGLTRDEMLVPLILVQGS